jgi:hypothetical protein
VSRVVAGTVLAEHASGTAESERKNAAGYQDSGFTRKLFLYIKR